MSYHRSFRRSVRADYNIDTLGDNPEFWEGAASAYKGVGRTECLRIAQEIREEMQAV